MRGNQQYNNNRQRNQYPPQNTQNQNSNNNNFQQHPNNNPQQNPYYHQSYPYPMYNPQHHPSQYYYYPHQIMQNQQGYNQYYQNPLPQQKATDPRKRKNEQIKLVEVQKSPLPDKNEKKKVQMSSQSQDSCSSSDQQKLFSKKKIIKKHPVHDSPEQIKKWLLARRKNYPKASENEQNIRNANRELNFEMSILQTKLRKKISILNSDPRSILKKAKTLDVLRKILLKRRNNRTKENRIKTTYQKQPFREDIRKVEQIEIQKQPQEKIEKIQIVNQQIQEISNQENESQTPQQVPIPKQPVVQQIPAELPQLPKRKPIDLYPEQIIEHLRQRQKQDKELANSLLQYKSNSFNYKYSCRTLETNFQLEEIFKESIYMLQAIRYIVNNKFFQQQNK